MNQILAIDPGNEKSAWLLYDRDLQMPIAFGIEGNTALVLWIETFNVKPTTHFAIEMVASYGMPVGKTVFETCVWIGRFIQAWGRPTQQIYRMEVKMCLCSNSRAKDGNIRQAIIDRYLPTGGGKIPEIGTKKHKGPLYGIKKDIWSALGVAITFAEERKYISKS